MRAPRRVTSLGVTQVRVGDYSYGSCDASRKRADAAVRGHFGPAFSSAEGPKALGLLFIEGVGGAVKVNDLSSFFT